MWEEEEAKGLEVGRDQMSKVINDWAWKSSVEMWRPWGGELKRLAWNGKRLEVTVAMSGQ